MKQYNKQTHCEPPPLRPDRSLSSSTTMERAIAGLVRDCSVHYVLPKTSLTPLLANGKLSVQQVRWSHYSLESPLLC